MKEVLQPKKVKKTTCFDVFNCLWMVLFSLFCLLPICIMVSASFSSDKTLAQYGYTLFPKDITFDAYKFVFQSGGLLLRSYLNSIIVTGAVQC